MAAKTFQPLPEPLPPDARVIERWESRLSKLANPQGLVLHITLGLKSTKPFYSPEVRECLRGFLVKFVPVFVLKLEVSYQPSGFLFPHAHLLTRPDAQVRPFFEGLRLAGVKVKSITYQNEVLPSPFSILPGTGPVNLGDFLASLVDLSPLEPLIAFNDSTLTTMKASPNLARYMAKRTYVGGLSPVMEHNLR